MANPSGIDRGMRRRARDIIQVTLAGLSVAGAMGAAPARAEPARDGAALQRLHAAAQAAFRRADTNGDGRLSPEEAARLPGIAAGFAEYDKNRDGFLSPDEFFVGYTSG